MKSICVILTMLAITACSGTGPTGVYDGMKYCTDLYHSGSSMPEMCQWRVAEIEQRMQQQRTLNN